MNLISQVSEELAYYLLHHSTATIPGLGSFESVYHSASIDQKSGELKAPNNSITFTSELIDNKGFQSFLNTQYPDQNLLSDFVDQFQEQLEAASTVSLSDIGEFTLGAEDEIQFSYQQDDDLLDDFGLINIALKPIQKETKEAEPVVANMPGASTKKATNLATPQKRKLPLLRIGMITSLLILTFAFFYNQNTSATNIATAKKVSAKYNVSPKAIEKEVIIVSNEADAYVEEISDEEQKNIIDRQEKMSVEVEEPVLFMAEITTNTFGNLANVKRQLEKIESQGYKGDTLVRANGLTATQIILQYQTEEELAQEMTKIKKSFPRAKLKK